MTEKQKKILISALELFAREGFKNTATSKVAKHADVSEGLIFRHFGNKDGLLNAIVREGEEKLKNLYADIVLETDAKEVLNKTIQMAEKIASNKEDIDFWKLQYKIKWELGQYGGHKMEPLERALSAAFEKLGYDRPALEAQFLLIHLDGLAMRFFLDEGFDMASAILFMKSRYGL